MLESESIKFLLTGSFFGLVAGISPGPLLALVISETIRHNRPAGIKIAVSPLITDLPIILLTLFVFSKLSDPGNILNIISFAGGIFLLYLAYKTLSVKDFYTERKGNADNSLAKGILANFLSPHPYLFWITVGSPYVIRAMDVNNYAAVYFVLGFYLFLIGSKIMVAFLASRSKNFLNQKKLVWIMRILGVALIVFGIILIRDGIYGIASPQHVGSGSLSKRSHHSLYALAPQGGGLPRFNVLLPTTVPAESGNTPGGSGLGILLQF